MTNRKAIFLHGKELEQLPYPESCPFNTSRAGGVFETIKTMGLLTRSNTELVEPTPALRPVLKKIHTAHYLKVLKDAEDGKFSSESLFMGLGTGDCPIFNGMYSYSALACGASVLGAEYILSGKADLAFNPSGGLHHAKSNKAAGFCYLNDVALACYILAEASRKVLYLDVDVHHGDGTQEFFYDRADVMTVSFHETGKMLFPGTGFIDEIGTGKGKGYSVNVPLPVGVYDELYLRAFTEIAFPLIDSYQPDVIVFELGADTLAGDPLAHLHLTNNAYADIINHLLSFNVPILMTGGGGYHIENTVRAWSLAWSVLCGADHGDDMSIGLGGVMMESTEHQGGLRDRELPITDQQQETVEPAVKAVIQDVKAKIFPMHGL